LTGACNGHYVKSALFLTNLPFGRDPDRDPVSHLRLNHHRSQHNGPTKETVEVPGQEPETGAEQQRRRAALRLRSRRLTLTSQRAEQEVIQQRVASLLDDAALAERNTLLGTINEQGAAIIARFETLGLHRPG
jgi:hypothetical protein